MKEYKSEMIRNVCLAGQRGCGKTSLADAIAYCTKVNNRIGRVDDGSSLLDYTEAETARKTSLTSKLLAVEWDSHKINLLDSPGHADFIGELLAERGKTLYQLVEGDILMRAIYITECCWTCCIKRRDDEIRLQESIPNIPVPQKGTVGKYRDRYVRPGFYFGNQGLNF